MNIPLPVQYIDLGMIIEDTEPKPSIVESKLHYPQSCANHRGKVWTEQEDSFIEWLVDQEGTKRWTYIARIMTEQLGDGLEYNPKQCRERWFNHLNPELNKGPWTMTEDIVILENKIKNGSKWSTIVQQLQGRTEHQIKNHYRSLTRKAKHLFPQELNKDCAMLAHLKGKEVEVAYNQTQTLITQPIYTNATVTIPQEQSATLARIASDYGFEAYANACPMNVSYTYFSPESYVQSPPGLRVEDLFRRRKESVDDSLSHSDDSPVENKFSVQNRVFSDDLSPSTFIAQQ